ncbi:hypothetical protein ABBQ38_000085 [Trebouxia sp. C0009 RCD-2024]
MTVCRRLISCKAAKVQLSLAKTCSRHNTLVEGGFARGAVEWASFLSHLLEAESNAFLSKVYNLTDTQTAEASSDNGVADQQPVESQDNSLSPDNTTESPDATPITPESPDTSGTSPVKDSPDTTASPDNATVTPESPDTTGTVKDSSDTTACPDNATVTPESPDNTTSIPEVAPQDNTATPTILDPATVVPDAKALVDNATELVKSDNILTPTSLPSLQDLPNIGQLVVEQLPPVNNDKESVVQNQNQNSETSFMGGPPLLVVGHSLGSGVAAIGALVFALKYGQGVSDIGFGTPRVGNTAWVNVFNSSVERGLE